MPVLRLRPVSRKKESDDRLIPLINVVFLMLIFFLLAGTIRPPEPFEIALPVSSSEQNRPDQTLVLMVGPDGTMFIDGVLLAPDRLGELKEQLSTRWPKEESARDTQLRKIEIQADQSLPLASLSGILTELTQAGADEISLITRR